MSPALRSPRKPSNLSESLCHRLNSYALAASAAGVGMMALALPSEAKVVYTATHRHILLNHPLDLDLNHDGIVDFRIGRHYSSASVFFGTQVSASNGGNSHNGVAGLFLTSYYQFTPAFHKGAEIGPLTDFNGGWMGRRRRSVGGSGGSCKGAWNDVANRYLGLKFEIKGKVHFGWARFNEHCNRDGKKGTGARSLLTGYAYETIPDKSIIAGKTRGPDVITLRPGSLGNLAGGAFRKSDAQAKESK